MTLALGKARRRGRTNGSGSMKFKCLEPQARKDSASEPLTGGTKCESSGLWGKGIRTAKRVSYEVG